ncbi:hypothetical protein DPMN_015168 [Dreissena polymorpha]|uniref:Uncharacterized protein n=1 Tax=Dreissena polymorpha TaxID=45954 RepID=A0A9D4NCA9_DREPO|nr:hypothetical protein DPMN_015168 [Dreissena polymorpha]
MASNYFGRMGYSLVTKGLTFQFEKRPSLSHVPIELVSQHPHIPQSILGLLEKQAVERVQDPYSPGFYSRLFLVQNKNGSWRPVIDLKVLNMYLLKPTFKMETFSFIRISIKHPALGGVFGSGRCVLPCSYTSQLPEVPSICLSWPSLPVLGHAIWVGDRPTSFYQTNGCSRSSLLSTRDCSSSVFRRLALTPARSSFTSYQPRILLEGTPLFRTPSQCRKIRPHSFSGLHFRGNEFLDTHQSGQSVMSTYIRPSGKGQLGFVPISYNSSRIPLSTVS